MAFKIFYAWQSDRPNNLCRGLIRRALEDAAKELEADPDIQDAERDGIEIDSDTQDIPGSPPVAETIFEKIRESDVFVADLTPIDLIVPEDDDAEVRRQPPPNPNVMLEYGYALGALGAGKIVGVMNEAFGKPDDLPFDLRHRRWPIEYQAAEGAADDQRRQARQNLTTDLVKALRPIIQLIREPEISDDEEAVRLNPGNGRRVVRLIMRASTEREVDDLYGDFKSAAHKTSDIEVFAAYALKVNRLQGGDQDDGWWSRFDDEVATFNNSDDIMAAFERLGEEFPDEG